MDSVNKVIDSISSLIGTTATNNYSLVIEGVDLASDLSILSLEESEIINQPWRYTSLVITVSFSALVSTMFTNTTKILTSQIGYQGTSKVLKFSFKKLLPI